MHPTDTVLTLTYGAAILAATGIALIILRRTGVMVKDGPLDNSVRRVVKVGVCIWFIVLGINLRSDVIHAQALAKQSACKGHMKGWALSLHNYLADHGRFPPSTTLENGHKHSWRVLVSPYLEARRVRDNYNLNTPWNSRENLALQTDLPTGYSHCTEVGVGKDQFITSYVAITGPDCVLRDDRYPARRFEDLDPEAVLFVETKRLDIHWMAPEDLSYERLIADRQYAQSVLGGPHPNGGCYATVDGQIRRINEIGIDELLRRCIVETPVVDDDAN